MTTEQKNNTKAAIVTAIVLIIILVLLLFVTLKSQNPPPPPKRMVMIELGPIGGGGGGGSPHAASPNKTKSTGKSTATQNADKNAPAVNKGTGKTNDNNAPKVNNNAMYGQRGSGSGGGSGSGSGTGFGSGFGPGEGGGSGGGIGYGNRKPVYLPEMPVKENGQVKVRVLVGTDGKVLDADIVPQGTTITNSAIRQECIAKAKQAKYPPSSKEEYNFIIFK